VAAHRRNAASLSKLHLQSESSKTGKSSFEQSFLQCIYRTLPLKPREPAAQKVTKFISTYLQTLSDQGLLFFVFF